MTPERWQRLSQLYHEARARSDEERTTFLAEACRDDEPLRREVERLLVGETSAEQLLDGGALKAAAQMVSSAGSVLTGRRVGSYQVGARLGAGGMGEVYRARDSRLGRDVAIKILPQAFTSDPDRLARFEREARMVAALNHPNIAAIYGVEEADGMPALVLELVEGETLADRIARGALAQNDALDIARQMTEALAAAHDKGIVHRDLKPANIKITLGGLVKVLDFGLAKAATGEVSGTDLTQSPTLTIGGTRDGVILGTAAYMSPEQARGQTVDKRTDIWAFGCVLYEMLTGRAAFARDTVTDTLAAIVEREPAWDTLPASTPTAVRRLLRRCLEKDSRRRLHDIADARIELEDVQSGAGAEAPAPAGSTTWARWPLVAALVLGALATLAWIGWTGRSDPTRSGYPSKIIAAAGIATVSPDRGIAITPDGSRVVYVGNKGTQLFVQALDQLEATPLVTGVAPLNWVMLSPDGEWVGFIEGSQVKKILIAGGPASLITVNTSASLTGAAWVANDTIVLASGDPATGLVQVSASGGDQTVLTRPDPSKGERDHLWPEPLPGGRSVLFTITATTGGPAASQIAVLDLATRAVTPVASGGSDARYVSSGHLVYVADGAMRAIAFDLDGLKTRGDPVIVLPRFRSAEGASGFHVSANGTIAYVDDPGTVVANTLVWVDRQNREEPLGADPHAYFHPRLSPDRRRVAVAINDDDGSHIWLWDLARPGLSQLFDPGFAPVWTRDSKHLLYFGRNDGLWMQPADGTGTARRLGNGLPSFVTSAGRVIFSPGGRDISILSLDGPPAEARLVSDEAAAERNAVVSPNGRWLAYESDEDGRFDIYVRPFPDVTKGGLWKVSTAGAGGTRPLWSPAGDELFYVAPDGPIMGVRVFDPSATTWSASGPVKILEGPYATTGTGSPRTYDIGKDGRFLMVKQPAAQSATPQIVVVQNWLEKLKRLVPAR